jgi:hypothetical protein
VTTLSEDEAAINPRVREWFPAIWGQYVMWDVYTKRPTSQQQLNLVWQVELPSGTSKSAALGAARQLFAEYSSFNTIFKVDSSGCLQQGILEDGPLPISWQEHPPDRQMAEIVDQTRTELTASIANLTRERASAAVILGRDGVARFAVLKLPHINGDLQSIKLAGDRLLAILENPDSEPPAGDQPRQIAAWQHGEHGDQANRRAVRHVDKQLRAASRGAFLRPLLEGERVRFQRAVLRSPAGRQAVIQLRTAYRASFPAVVLAATAIALHAHSGVPRLPFQFVSGNRFRRETRGSVASLSQAIMAVVPVEENEFSQLLRQTERASLEAMRFGEYDPRLIAPVAEAACAEIGVVVDTNCMFNASVADLAELELPSAPADEVLTPTTFAWVDELDDESMTFYIRHRMRATHLDLALLIDTRRLTRTEGETLAWGIERILVAAATGCTWVADLAEASGIDRVPAQEGDVLVDGCPVSLPAVQAMLGACLEAAEVGVETCEGEGSDVRLVAHLSFAGDSLLTLEDIHARVMSRLPNHPECVAPLHYVVHPVGDSTRSDWWRGRPVLATGSGRPVPTPAV